MNPLPPDCACGHARLSHIDDGKCTRCSCLAFTSGTAAVVGWQPLSGELANPSLWILSQTPAE